jgi:hypothetical protein
LILQRGKVEPLVILEHAVVVPKEEGQSLLEARVDKRLESSCIALVVTAWIIGVRSVITMDVQGKGDLPPKTTCLVRGRKISDFRKTATDG